MISKSKRRDKTYIRYYYEKLALLNACEIFDRKAVSCIVAGISEPHVQSAARSSDYPEPEALFRYLRALPTDTSSTPHTTYFSENIDKKVHVGKPRDKLIHFERKERGRNAQNVTYNSCGKTGHYNSNCSQRNTLDCSFCKKRGHVESVCYAKKKTPNPVA